MNRENFLKGIKSIVSSRKWEEKRSLSTQFSADATTNSYLSLLMTAIKRIQMNLDATIRKSPPAPWFYSRPMRHGLDSILSVVIAVLGMQKEKTTLESKVTKKAKNEQ